MSGPQEPSHVEAGEQRGDVDGDVHVSRCGHVATVTILKPPHNSMSVELARDLADTLENLDEDADIRAVVLASEGRSFCAGADLSKRADEVGIEPTDDVSASNPLYEQAVRLYGAQLPIVAAIQGPAVGAGLGLALVADFRIASPAARFAANFVKLGFHPGFGLTYTLPRLLGPQRASLLLLTGRRIKADEALEIGLIDQIAPADVLLPTAHALAEEIAENAPLAVRSTRATLRAGLADSVREATEEEFAEQRWLMRTEDFREGIRAVSERRPGDFKSR
ncbi:MAG: enoyl-CoA hydratase/isomerase family protein [Hyphomonadaceae bacterium]